MSERQILFGWEFLVDIKPARSGAPAVSDGAGTGSTSAGTTSQEFYARTFDARCVPSVAFTVSPAVVDQSTAHEDRVALAEFGSGGCEFTPGGDVDEMRALLIVAGTVMEALVHGDAEAAHRMIPLTVTLYRVTRQVADDTHIVECVLRPRLVTGGAR